jgi:hypothetical protein
VTNAQVADAAGTAAAAALADARRDEGARPGTPLGGAAPLVDAHAHFFHAATPRADWPAVNAARLRAGERIGVTWHVASVLGTWGQSSPTYFASPDDVTLGNDVMYAVADRCPDRVRAYVHVNPNFPDHARAEIARGVARGAVGVKLSASRRADDRLLDPVAAEAGRRGLPVLHHVWQWRRRDWPMQEASDAVELARLARRATRTRSSCSPTSGAAASTCTPSRPSPTCPTCTSTCRGAASTAACSTPRSPPWARAGSSGRAT